MLLGRKSAYDHLKPLCFSEHLLKCVPVWTQSTSSLNTLCVILLKQKTMQEWSLIS